MCVKVLEDFSLSLRKLITLVNLAFNLRYVKINAINECRINQYRSLPYQIDQKGFGKTVRCEIRMYKLSPYLCNMTSDALSV